MAKRIIIGGIVGGVTLFMWGFISWVIAGWHDATIISDPSITAVIDGAEAHLPDSGVYYFPPMPEDHGDQAAMDAWEQSHRDGPIGMLVWNRFGTEVGSGSMLAKGLLLNIGLSMMAAVLLWLALPSLSSYAARCCYVSCLGLLAVMATRFTDAVFFAFPSRYMMGQAIDGIVGWVLVGLVLAMIVKPRR